MLIVSPDSHVLDSQLMLPFQGYPTQEYKWTPARAKAAWDEAYAELRDIVTWDEVEELVLLCGIPGAGKSTWLSQNAREGVVYFDATFTNKRARRPVIQIGKDAGVKVSIQVINTPFETCVERNNTRTADRQVPPDVMERMRDSLKKEFPTSWEGVTVTADSPFTFTKRMSLARVWFTEGFYKALGAVTNSLLWQSIPTWVWETTTATLVLFGVFGLDPSLVNAVAGIAVLFTFQYMTVSYRLMETQDKQEEVTVACYKILPKYLWAKEMLWVLVFLLTGAHTAIVGNVLFLLYPFWRRVYLRSQR